MLDVTDVRVAVIQSRKRLPYTRCPQSEVPGDDVHVCRGDVRVSVPIQGSAPLIYIHPECALMCSRAVSVQQCL